jgi:hypothetical protein
MRKILISELQISQAMSYECGRFVYKMCANTSLKAMLYPVGINQFSNPAHKSRSFAQASRSLYATLSTVMFSKITVLSGDFYTLSTPLIIRAIWMKEENILIRHGG